MSSEAPVTYHAKQRRIGRIAFIVAVLLAVYVGLHIVISRQSSAKMATQLGGESGFFYFPVDMQKSVGSSNEDMHFRIHVLLSAFFYPARQIDSRIFGGPRPIFGWHYVGVVNTNENSSGINP